MVASQQIIGVICQPFVLVDIRSGIYNLLPTDLPDVESQSGRQGEQIVTKLIGCAHTVIVTECGCATQFHVDRQTLCQTILSYQSIVDDKRTLAVILVMDNTATNIRNESPSLCGGMTCDKAAVHIPKKICMNHLVITDILAGILELKTLETKPTTNIWREPFSCLYCQGRFHPVEQVPRTMWLPYKGRYATRHTNEPVGRPYGRYSYLFEVCRLYLSEHILIYARRYQIIRAIIYCLCIGV